MKIISSYQVKLMDHQGMLSETVKIYRKAVAFLIDVANKEWDNLAATYAKGPKSCTSNFRRDDSRYKSSSLP